MLNFIITHLERLVGLFELYKATACFEQLAYMCIKLTGIVGLLELPTYDIFDTYLKDVPLVSLAKFTRLCCPAVVIL